MSTHKFMCKIIRKKILDVTPNLVLCRVCKKKKKKKKNANPRMNQYCGDWFRIANGQSWPMFDRVIFPAAL